MIYKIPTHWLQLTYRKARLLVSILGVASAAILMFVQLGFRDGLFETSISIHKHLKADLVLLHSKTEYFEGMKEFPLRFLYLVSSIDGVESVSPFYYSEGNFKNPENAKTKPITVYAFTPEKPVFNLPEVNQQLNVLTKAKTVLFDRLSRSEYGPISLEFLGREFLTTELSNRRIRIGGLFSLGSGVLASDGTLIMSDLNYSKILDKPLEKVHMGLLQLEPGIEPESVVQKLSLQIPENLKLMTLEKFMEEEKKYWIRSTPIGFIFNAGTVIGCFFGGIIVYQILYTQISDNLYVYAIFKAVGYSNHYLVTTVMKQSFLMCVMGYIPGFLTCLYLYNFIGGATRMPITMTLSRAGLVFFLTAAMCSFAGIISINKLRSANPADLFR
ncbi:ABC transporter permease DevC [Mastigocoleus testarum]|uniref:DevC protein n=1 Tax=Mastigocoleus testarum BC008 TaxID=371196 RepID=A0A0V8A172_9CYAN|nr:ABC transporter permease DevC [Mastigocoleus testarum]KST70369.1 DevC protein [Mastigocoleus testarum BC008]